MLKAPPEIIAQKKAKVRLIAANQTNALKNDKYVTCLPYLCWIFFFQVLPPFQLQNLLF